MDHNTVLGGFRVDRNGFQIAYEALMFQWQDGKKVLSSGPRSWHR
jgi:hypothetical protein